MRSRWSARCERRTVDADVVKEVLADLDIQKLTWGVPSEKAASNRPTAAPGWGQFSGGSRRVIREISNAAEAAAYMQQVALKLRTWRESLDKTPAAVRHDSTAPAARERER